MYRFFARNACTITHLHSGEMEMFISILHYCCKKVTGVNDLQKSKSDGPWDFELVGD